jgi:hypothetical protein
LHYILAFAADLLNHAEGVSLRRLANVFWGIAAFPYSALLIAAHL